MKPTHLAVFDLDKTLVVDNCSFAFCRYLVKQKELPFVALVQAWIYYIRHVFLGMGLAELHEGVFTSLLKGKLLSRLEAYVEPFLNEYLPSNEYFPVLAKLRLAQQLGHYTLILSNSPSFLVAKVADYLRVDAWYATEYAVDKEGMLMHIALMMQGEEKAVVVKQVAAKLSIPTSQVVAYSDSFLDLPLLLSVGEAIAVNPDGKLRRFSKVHNWAIL